MPDQRQKGILIGGGWRCRRRGRCFFQCGDHRTAQFRKDFEVLGRRRFVGYEIENTQAAEPEPQGQDERHTGVKTGLRATFGHHRVFREFGVPTEVRYHHRLPRHDGMGAERIVLGHLFKLDPDDRFVPLRIFFHDTDMRDRTVKKLFCRRTERIEQHLVFAGQAGDILDRHHARIFVEGKGECFHCTTLAKPGHHLSCRLNPLRAAAVNKG